MAQYLDLNSDAGASNPTLNTTLNPTLHTNDLASLAEKLVQRLGVTDALRMCQENSWYGVFNVIKGHAKIDGQ